MGAVRPHAFGWPTLFPVRYLWSFLGWEGQCMGAVDSAASVRSKRFRRPVCRLSTSKSACFLVCEKKTKMIFEPLPESHTKFISICSDGASPNSTALIVRGPTPLVSQICEASSGREYEHTGRAGARADGPRRIWSRC